MTKHYILSINPEAEYDWDKVSLRNPISGNRPDFNKVIAEAVGEEPGTYLVAINIEVEVLEQETANKQEVTVEVPREKKANKPTRVQELAAS